MVWLFGSLCWLQEDILFWGLFWKLLSLMPIYINTMHHQECRRYISLSLVKIKICSCPYSFQLLDWLDNDGYRGKINWRLSFWQDRITDLDFANDYVLFAEIFDIQLHALNTLQQGLFFLLIFKWLGMHSSWWAFLIVIFWSVSICVEGLCCNGSGFSCFNLWQ